MLKTISLILVAFLFAACHTTTYYIIRHAEKESTNTMTSDVPLSAAGEQRAERLGSVLKDKNIRYLYSTNYSRTLSTIEPLRRQLGLTINLYDTKDTLNNFINTIRNLKDGNVLIVGHANTVPTIINALTGKKLLTSDLPDTAYSNIFIIKKTNNNYKFDRINY